MNDPRQAWQAAREQLRAEMAPAVFDRWVGPTDFHDYQDGVVSIAVPNPETAAWLNDRLAETVRRQLAGLLDQQVEVRFTLAGDPNHPGQPPETERPDQPMLVEVERGLLEAFTRPDTALYFPGYWLRWVPYIGAKPFATILAFRQALYLAEAARHGRGDFKENTYFAVSAEKVGKLIGVTAKTIRRQRDGYRTASGKLVPPQLDWFLTVRKTNKVNFSSGSNRFAREAHQYAFKQSPVTPGDIEAVVEWLLDRGLSNDPIKALEDALQAQPREYLPFPMPRPSKVQRQAKPASGRADLLANILSYCPAGIDAETRRKVLDLAGRLRARIVEADGQVKVPLYFLRHILPVIGAPAAVLVCYLRKKAYRNTATGEVREQVTLEDGIAELAVLLGVGPSAVYYHLPINCPEPGECDPRQDLLNQLIYQIDNHNGHLKLRISTADPLLPAHEREYQRALALAGIVLQTGSPEEARACFALLRQAKETLSKNVHMGDSNFVQIEDSKNGQMEASENVHLADSKNVPIGLSKDVHLALSDWLEKCPDKKYFKFLSLETLENIILSLNTNLNTLTTSPSGTSAAGAPTIRWTAGVGEGWSLEKLADSCRIDQASRKALAENGASASAFVSQLLYAFSPEGAGLKQPVRFALSQVLRPGDGDLGSGPRHDRLAGLGPAGLQRLIRETEIVPGYSFEVPPSLPGAPDWRRIMGGLADREKLLELAELLSLCDLGDPPGRNVPHGAKK
jgi:hypothetical protein